MHHKALLLACLKFGVVVASNDPFSIGSCEGIYVTIWGQGGDEAPKYYITDSDTYTLPMPYQTIGSTTTATSKEYLPSSISNILSTSPTSLVDIQYPTPTSTSSPRPTHLVHTQNGYCATNGATCLGWGAGQCCSQSNSCGNTTDYCGQGCQPEYGLCGVSSSVQSLLPSSSQPIPSPTPSVASCVGLNFATFYSLPGFAGTSYEACGDYASCYNVSQSFYQDANSMAFNAYVAGSCALFSAASCSGQSIDVFNGDPLLTSFTNYQFSGAIVSYRCYANCPVKGKRGPRGAAC